MHIKFYKLIEYITILSPLLYFINNEVIKLFMMIFFITKKLLNLLISAFIQK